ncbi:type II secretion system protein N [Sphingosinicella soli]|uniref:General secretion pathway protein C n=1 Tax=Sphingosinicella soli TaxID=333708 RepID=A0A7W7B0T3_9SPHN|nr:type II secretion system protein N [Sphingosinicella soli]MBB4631929.1 general secretion pathway protein C [Sphingosinicella soli]
MGFTDRQWLQRVSARDLVAAAQVLLALLLALATARLVWALLAPIGPIGSPPPQAVAAKSDLAVLGRFDPFFQMLDGGPAVVSDLAIDLYGTRVDNVSGRGSAIIGVDGTQRSFLVGEEIMPGVILHGVAFDSVTVRRSGALEQLFLDQSVPARAVSPAPVDAAAPPPQIPLERVGAEITGELVRKGNQVDGLALKPIGSGGLFNEIGLKTGDVLLSVNGVRIDSETPPGGIANLIGDSDVAVLEIRRGAEVQSVTFEIVQ